MSCRFYQFFHGASWNRFVCSSICFARPFLFVSFRNVGRLFLQRQEFHKVRDRNRHVPGKIRDGLFHCLIKRNFFIQMDDIPFLGQPVDCTVMRKHTGHMFCWQRFQGFLHRYKTVGTIIKIVE